MFCEYSILNQQLFRLQIYNAKFMVLFMHFYSEMEIFYRIIWDASLSRELKHPFLLIQWFSIRSSFTYQETFGSIRRHFWLSKVGRKYYWHLVDGGRGGCRTSCNVQNSLHSRELSRPQMSILLKLTDPSLSY